MIHTKTAGTSPLDSVVGVIGKSPIRLAGRLLVSAKLLAVVLWLNVRVKIVDVDAEVVSGFLPWSFRLGGMYSFFSVGASPFSDADGLRVSTLAEPKDPLPDISFSSTESTIVLRTPRFVISFLRSARAASVTFGPVKSSTTDWRAVSRTVPSVSSNASTSCGRYGFRGKVGCERRTWTSVRMDYDGSSVNMSLRTMHWGGLTCSRTRHTLLPKPPSLMNRSQIMRGVSVPFPVSFCLNIEECEEDDDDVVGLHLNARLPRTTIDSTLR